MAKSGLMVVGIIVGMLAAFGFAAYAFSGGFQQAIAGGPQAPETVPTPTGENVPSTEACLPTVTPTITVRTNDKYIPGTAVTSQNMIRLQGTETWVDVAGAATFAPNVGDVYEVVIGIDSDDEGAEPYGPKFMYTVPCKETDTLLMDGVSTLVRNDALATDLVATAFDEFGNVISAYTNAQDVDIGDVDTASIEWSASYREDFGNIYCGKYSNVLVGEYNTTGIDKLDVPGLEPATVPTVFSKTSGFSQKAWKFPVLESSTVSSGGKYNYDIAIDADDTASSHIISGATSNITFTLYDSSWYLDNDDNKVKCGVEDENNAEIGAAAADTLVYVISADSA